jgi:hypothetical protein
LSVTKFHTHTNNIKSYSSVYLNLKFLIHRSKPEVKTFCTEWKQAFPDYNLLLIFSWVEFLFVRVPKYLNSSTLSKGLLSIFILNVNSGGRISPNKPNLICRVRDVPNKQRSKFFRIKYINNSTYNFSEHSYIMSIAGITDLVLF